MCATDWIKPSVCQQNHLVASATLGSGVFWMIVFGKFGIWETGEYHF